MNKIIRSKPTELVIHEDEDHKFIIECELLDRLIRANTAGDAVKKLGKALVRVKVAKIEEVLNET